MIVGALVILASMGPQSRSSALVGKYSLSVHVILAMFMLNIMTLIARSLLFVTLSIVSFWIAIINLIFPFKKFMEPIEYGESKSSSSACEATFTQETVEITDDSLVQKHKTSVSNSPCQEEDFEEDLEWGPME
ncbi:hypothetical protein ROZALSC1DRAFT_25934, partial [Rozella allomycis CSF55]